MSVAPDLSAIVAASGRQSSPPDGGATSLAVTAVALTGAWAVWAHLGRDSLVVALMAALCLTATQRRRRPAEATPQRGDPQRRGSRPVRCVPGRRWQPDWVVPPSAPPGRSSCSS